MKYNKISGYLISFFFALTILILSIYPSDASKTNVLIFKGMDKIIHALMYGIFTVLFLRDYLRYNSFKPKNIMVIVVAICLYSLIIELIQHFFIESRSGELLDMVANIFGIATGTAIIAIIKNRLN